MRKLGWFLVAAGLALAAFLSWELVGTDVVAHRGQAKTLKSLEKDFAEPRQPVSSPGPVKRPPVGTAFAVLRVPAMKLTVPIVEGTGSDQLDQGVGHYPNSPMPGSAGNVSLAGHRTTHGAPFSRIAELEVGDVISIETQGEVTIYKVTNHWIVDPSDVAVVSSKGLTGQHVLTMTSCHPKFSARQRYVVRAVQI